VHFVESENFELNRVDTSVLQLQFPLTAVEIAQKSKEDPALSQVLKNVSGAISRFKTSDPALKPYELVSTFKSVNRVRISNVRYASCRLQSCLAASA